jgi:hypothetical protein
LLAELRRARTLSEEAGLVDDLALVVVEAQHLLAVREWRRTSEGVVVRLVAERLCKRHLLTTNPRKEFREQT